MRTPNLDSQVETLRASQTFDVSVVGLGFEKGLLCDDTQCADDLILLVDNQGSIGISWTDTSDANGAAGGHLRHLVLDPDIGEVLIVQDDTDAKRTTRRQNAVDFADQGWSNRTYSHDGATITDRIIAVTDPVEDLTFFIAGRTPGTVYQAED